ncbi:lipoprotein signal peptidase [Nesterenkonia sp. AN1]|uniref:Lipoprotein signal peptidase n=2 Tax=Micrococcaceae TaxID=1268 RepID=A0A4R7G3G7_9MICC|nr:lipoprotein signal peptidase [Nesterenkonia sp. AN1]TDS85787.1 signal peptidase II [Nesterenkonia aurantiaca]
MRTPSRRTALIVAAALAVFAWAADQLTKIWVESTMTLGEQTEVLPPVLYWRYHLNPGAAFSMGTDYTWVFTLIMIGVLGYVAFKSRELGGSWLWTLGLGGLAGGVAGNLTDRIFRAPSLTEEGFNSFGQGHVVDFIAVPNFAIFNIADSFIVCSIIAICTMMIFGLNLDGTREHDAEQPDAEQPGNEKPDAEQPAPKRSATSTTDAAETEV